MSCDENMNRTIRLPEQALGVGTAFLNPTSNVAKRRICTVPSDPSCDGKCPKWEKCPQGLHWHC